MQDLTPSPYDPIAGLYDDWSRQVTEDVGFYVEEALAAGGPVVELGVGTGGIAVPTALAGGAGRGAGGGARAAAAGGGRGGAGDLGAGGLAARRAALRALRAGPGRRDDDGPGLGRPGGLAAAPRGGRLRGRRP